MTFATTLRRGIAAVGLIALATPALAHTGHGGAADFVSGFMHPLLGLDHVLAMLAVGVLAARQGGRAALAIPAGFLVAMLVGGLALPLVELGIVGSIVVLGLAIVFAERVPAAAAVALAAAFGLFHGHAHGTEIATDAVFASVATGFVLATALLHLAGLAIARLPMPTTRGLDFARASGVAFSLAGVALFLA